MPTKDPTSVLDPAKDYSTTEFLKTCKIDESLAAIVLMRVISDSLQKRRGVRFDQISATGAEFIKAVGIAERLTAAFRRHGGFVISAGSVQVLVDDPSPPEFIELVRQIRNS